MLHKKNWYQYFIPDPKYFRDSREEEKAVLLLKSLPLFLILTSISMLQKGMLTGEISMAHFMGMLALGAIPVILKYKKSYRLAASILPIAGIILIPINAISEGGFYSNGMVWFGMLPVVSTFFLGPTVGLWFSLFAMFELLVIGIFHTYGQIDYVASELTSSYAYKAIGTFGIVVFGTFFSRLYEKQTLKTEEELKHAHDLAEAAINEKNAFWTTLSHEIKTPLNGILGLSEVVLTSSLSKEQREYIANIKDSAEALNLILRDVIDFSQLERSEINLNKVPTDFRNMLDQLVSVFSYSAKSKGIQLSWVADQDIPELLIFDEKRVSQILSNLISNAIKFTQKGSIKIVVEYTEKSNSYRFSVCDTGIGMNREQIRTLFIPFKSNRENNSLSQNWGTGLGLAISQRLCRLMGSDLFVKSTVGKGSEFSFVLEAMPMALHRPNESDIGTVPLLKRNQNAYILVAEDNLVNQKLLANHLTKLGFRYRLTSNGKEAVKACHEEKFDLILMDIQMPYLDGIEASKIIKNHMQENSPKIIACSANLIELEKSDVKESGIIDYLAKPISLHALRTCLTAHCNYYEDPRVLYNHIDNQKDKLVVQRTESEMMIDREALLDHFEYDLDLIGVLLSQFKERYIQALSEIKEAIKNKDFDALKFSSHSLKGALSNFFCESLRNCALGIEQKASIKDLTNVEDLYLSLENGIPKMINEIEYIVTTENELRNGVA
ncbi:MAG: hypothetical protein Fur0010_16130 [Bdellovibrio sp.]